MGAIHVLRAADHDVFKKRALSCAGEGRCSNASRSVIGKCPVCMLPPLAELIERQESAWKKVVVRARIAELEAALEFYADPETYFGVAFLFDHPTGGFDEDFDTATSHPDGNSWHKPGKLARAALARGETAP